MTFLSAFPGGNTSCIGEICSSRGAGGLAACCLTHAATYHFQGTGADAAANQLFDPLDPLYLGNPLYYTAEARGGNGAVNGDHELNWHRVTPSPFGYGSATAETAQFAWGNGVAYEFTVEYDPAASGADRLRFSFDDAGTSGGPQEVNPTFLQPEEETALPFLNTLWLRLNAAPATGTTAASASLTSLILRTGAPALGLARPSQALNDQSAIDTVRPDNWIYTGLDLGDGFTLTGELTFAWTGTFPSNSRLDFNAKLAGAPVPEPSTYAAATMVLAAGLWTWRRRQK